MASRLKQLGYTQTTLLERSDRVGGKSLTIYLNETGECVQKQEKGKRVAEFLTWNLFHPV